MTCHVCSMRSLLGLAFLVVLSLLLSTSALAKPSSEGNASSPQDDNVTKFINTINTIKQSYAKSVDEKKLLEDAIRGMVSNLDPHSEYLDEDSYKNLLTTASGEFGGLGVEVTTEFGVLKVVTPIDNTPAAKAGIKSGDYIVALNGKLVNEISPDEAVKEMRGKKGTHIALVILRKGTKDPLNFNLIRDNIRIDSIKSNLLDNDYGYVRISQFQEPTSNLLINAIKTLKKQAGGHLKGLILDLRNNPGGLLESAADVTNVFLESDKLTSFDKLLVYTEGRIPEAQYKAVASGHDLLETAPLIVLINEGSASASEIVAGALQDYRRAVIVGTPSFGKGSVQTVLPLDKTHAVKLTTALYHTPSGRIIQNKGIIPDVLIQHFNVTEAKPEGSIDPVREFQLKDHLNNPDSSSPLASHASDLKKLAQTDFQLYESLNLLKVMSLKNSKP